MSGTGGRGGGGLFPIAGRPVAAAGAPVSHPPREIRRGPSSQLSLICLLDNLQDLNSRSLLYTRRPSFVSTTDAGYGGHLVALVIFLQRRRPESHRWRRRYVNNSSFTQTTVVAFPSITTGGGCCLGLVRASRVLMIHVVIQCYACRPWTTAGRPPLPSDRGAPPPPPPR